MNRGDIRRAQVADAPAMARIVSDWEAATEWMDSAYGPEEISSLIQEALPDREIWIIGAPIAGYLSYDPAVSRVGGLYCRNAGQGLGKALMDKVKEGRDFIWLHTHEANEAAQRFYKREGFEEVSRHDGDIHKDLREVRMEWRR